MQKMEFLNMGTAARRSRWGKRSMGIPVFQVARSAGLVV
jgi:hypothetical protein